MTYHRTQRPSDRMATFVAVGALQAAVFYALIAGFSVAFTPVDNPPPISATNSPLPPPPAPDTPVQTRSHEREIVTTITPLPSPLPSVVPIAMATPAPGPARDGEGPAQTVIPEPRPAISPVSPQPPKPLGRPGEWVTEADYPTNSIRLGHAGLVGFALSVSTSGRATGCEITRSSGFAELDALTCTLMMRRGRFKPATDDQGAVTTGRYASAVRWQIPD